MRIRQGAKEQAGKKEVSEYCRLLSSLLSVERRELGFEEKNEDAVSHRAEQSRWIFASGSDEPRRLPRQKRYKIQRN